jgi:hypothetical protein
MLCIIWWMYIAYAWLTNSVAQNSPLRRGLLLVGMGGFLAISLAIPQAFGAAWWLFGLGYFVVNAVHTGVFALAGGESVVRALCGRPGRAEPDHGVPRAGRRHHRGLPRRVAHRRGPGPRSAR